MTLIKNGTSLLNAYFMPVSKTSKAPNTYRRFLKMPLLDVDSIMCRVNMVKNSRRPKLTCSLKYKMSASVRFSKFFHPQEFPKKLIPSYDAPMIKVVKLVCSF
ncbi:hypothetical protein DSQ19_07040 [Candidatus Nitrosotenuis sp. DW1]|nr:hypothetical protein DSQ19_07040 [Candidatus Nitrosotenuis sp. DW1]